MHKMPIASICCTLYWQTREFIEGGHLLFHSDIGIDSALHPQKNCGVNYVHSFQH